MKEYKIVSSKAPLIRYQEKGAILLILPTYEKLMTFCFISLNHIQYG